MREAVFQGHLLNGWFIDLSVFDSGKIASLAGKCPPLPGLNDQFITGMIRAVGKINPPLTIYIFINSNRKIPPTRRFKIYGELPRPIVALTA
jgi:hypothetical protein